MNVVLVVGKRGHKIKGPLSTTMLRVIEVCTEDLNWIARARAVVKLCRCLLMRNTIVVADYPGYFSLVALIGSRLTFHPFVLRLRGDIWIAVPQWKTGSLLRIRLAIANYIIRNADLIISVSQFLANRVVEQTHVPIRKVVTIPIPVGQNVHLNRENGLPLHIQQLTNQSQKTYLILTITNFNFKGKLQGLRQFMGIFKEVLLVREDVLWLVAGSGRYLQTFQQEVSQQLPFLTDKVILLDYVYPITRLIEQAHVVVYFSYEDGFPNVPLEAQLAGKLVLVNDYPPLLEQVQDGKTGFVIDPENVESAANLICKCFDDAELRNRIGKQARLSVEVSYNESVIGRMFQDVLCGMVTSS